jgi:hypothetical protein
LSFFSQGYNVRRDTLSFFSHRDTMSGGIPCLFSPRDTMSVGIRRQEIGSPAGYLVFFLTGIRCPVISWPGYLVRDRPTTEEPTRTSSLSAVLRSEEGLRLRG